jgi:hypothetical protein
MSRKLFDPGFNRVGNLSGSALCWQTGFVNSDGKLIKPLGGDGGPIS